MRVLLGLLLLLVNVSAKPFPLEYLGDAGDIREGQARRFGDITVRVIKGGTRVRLEGKAWSVAVPLIGGIWAAQLYRADLDGDGRQDFLLDFALPVFNGKCLGLTQLYWIQWDAAGRPILKTAETYTPHRITDNDGDGRAEFQLTDCQGNHVSQWEEGGAKELELEGEWAPLRELEWGENLPRIVLQDGPEGRAIWVEDTIAALKSAMRDGYATVWKKDVTTGTSVLWIDANRRMQDAGAVRAEYVIRSQKHGEVEEAGKWEVLADGRTLRISHSAMQITHVRDMRFEPPPGARRLVYWHMDLAQWQTKDGYVLSLHDQEGRLLESRVEIAIQGRFIGQGAKGELAFREERGNVTLLSGTLRWQR